MKNTIFAILTVLILAVVSIAQSKQNAAELDRQYGSLVEALCRISEAYYYEGRMSDAVRLLENGAQMLKQAPVSPADAVKFRLRRGKIICYKNSTDGSDYKESIAFLLDAQKSAKPPKTPKARKTRPNGLRN